MKKAKKARNVIPVDLDDNERLKIELTSLRQLESAIRDMFEYSGWDQECDPEPAMCVDRVSKRLDELDAVRESLL